jgi:serine phosphatase RsbU (regulator of sigma subunit)
MDPSKDLFGDARVAELASRRDLREGALLHDLLAKVRAFEAGSPQSDDIAAILLRLADSNR